MRARIRGFLLLVAALAVLVPSAVLTFGASDRYDLANYGYRTVVTNGKGALVFQDAPNGAFMNSYQYNDGDRIYVNLYWRSEGYAIAYRNGVYGYVDAKYINWGGSSDSRYDLSFYAYRTVVTNGKGALVFQDAPNGGFMNKYQFYDGDSIYVNLDWRQSGYAIAYQDGVYGYVDAKYINWGSSPSDDGRYDLEDYGYRTVKTNGRGALVFQDAPDGDFMYEYEFWDGDSLYVNLYWRRNGYAIAYYDGVYGYVDASYINWNSSPGDGRFDLTNYDYRTVRTKGRGALVFQTAPNGSFMYDYEFWDGDSLYVNLYWRQSGYAIAYYKGTYGYVDASYLSW